MHSKLIANWPVRHNGRRFQKGDEVTPITRSEADSLVLIGAASWSAVLPPDEKLSGGDEVEDVKGATMPVDDIDWDEKSKRYHTQFGNYEIPGVGHVKGKQAAIEALKSLHAQSKEQ